MHQRSLTHYLAPAFLVAITLSAIGQTAPVPQRTAATPVAPSSPVPPKPRKTNLSFTSEDPILGLPLGANRPRAHCAVDGTAYFDFTANSAHAGQDLYGISSHGAVKHLLRQLPVDFTHIFVRDLFTGDKQIVTLLEADNRDETAQDASPRDTTYFIALEDTSGDVSNLIQLHLRFKPIRIARFSSGDILVLGWDEGNMLPELAVLNLDGTPHRFIDFAANNLKPGQSAISAAREEERATYDTLQGASFVAFGPDILLTYPGTTKPVRQVTASGDIFNIPISIPSGYVLNDVLVSSGTTLVVRVKQMPTESKPDPSASAPPMRLFEEIAYSGAAIREFIFNKPAVADVTCAPNSFLSAIFYDVIPDASNSQASDPTAAPPTQLVVASTRR